MVMRDVHLLPLANPLEARPRQRAQTMMQQCFQVQFAEQEREVLRRQNLLLFEDRTVDRWPPRAKGGVCPLCAQRR